MAQGTVVIASAFPPNEMVGLYRVQEGESRVDATAELLEQRAVDADERVGFAPEGLEAGDRCIAKGLAHGVVVEVPCKAVAVERGSGELAQPAVTDAPNNPVGTQEQANVPNNPAAEPAEHVEVGVAQGAQHEPPDTPVESEDVSSSGGPTPPESTEAQAPVAAPESAPEPQAAGAEASSSEPQEPPPTAPEPATETAESPAPEAHIGSPDVEALVAQAVSVGIEGNTAAMSVDELRQAITEKGQTPVA